MRDTPRHLCHAAVTLPLSEHLKAFMASDCSRTVNFVTCVARQQFSCHLSVNVLFWWLTGDGIDIDKLRCFTETMVKRVAVILSGCGVYDGTEIHEASAVLVHLSRAGAKVRDFSSFHFIGKEHPPG